MFDDRLGINSTLMTVNHTQAQIANQLAAMKVAGINWLRTSFSWPDMETSQGVWNFDNPDYVVANAPNVIGILSGAPLWANGGKQFYPPTDMTQWLAFVRRVIQRYPSIRMWEVWNEENINFWQPVPSPTDYMTLLRQTFAQIKAVDPTLKVIAGGLASAGGDFFKACLGYGLSAYTDAINYHPYVDTFWYGNELPQEDIARTVLATNRALFAQYSANKYEVWLTEIGWMTQGYDLPGQTNVTESQQADYWVRSVINYLEQNVDKIFYYDLWEMAVTGSGSDAWGINHYGLLRYDFTQKPAYTAFKNLQAQLAQVTSAAPGLVTATVSTGKLPCVVEVHSFKKANGKLLVVVWTRDNSTTTTNLTYQNVTVATVNVSGTPVFLEISNDHR